MNKLLKYGMTGLLGISMATPAMALTGFGPNNTNNGSHWQNQYEGQGQGQNGQSWGQSWGQSRNYGNQQYGENNGQNGYYGQNDSNQSNGGMSQAVSQGFVAHLQRRLQQQGFYHQGGVDGIWGPETQSALQNFQQQNNLRPTGQINMRTLQALNLMNGSNGRYQNYGQNQNYDQNQNNGRNGQQYSQNGNNDGYNGNYQNDNNSRSGWNGNNMGNNGGGNNGNR